MKTVRHSTWQGRNTQLHDCSSFRYTEIYTASSSSVPELRCTSTFYRLLFCDDGGRGGVVVKVLRYKSEGRWFESRWCHWNFSLT